MSNELTVIKTNGPTDIQQGGAGVDFGSKFFRLKPATININQPNTTAEGAIKGHLRISETGDQFEEMFVTLLTMPQEQRSYYTGNTGQLNRTPENLMCFSRDMIRPDKNAKLPQSMTCKSCPKADWGPYRDARDKGLNPGKELIPPCDAFYYALFIDTVFKMPLQMYIRSKSKAPFEAGMQNVARTIAMMQAQNKNPNIYDVRFRLSTKLIKTGNLPSYVLNISDVKAVSQEDRDAFGDVYQNYIKHKNNTPDAEEEAEEKIAQAGSDVDFAVAGGEYVGAIEV